MSKLKTVDCEQLSSSDFEYKPKQAKVLLFDIETAPIIAAVWNFYQTDVVWTVEDWYMLGWSAKWLGGKQTTKGLCDYKNYKPGSTDDKELCKELWDLLNEADVVIAHNGNAFDVKKVKARFVKNGLPPMAPFKQIDTKLMAKKVFGFSSNKLDEIGRFLGLGRKLQTGGKALWQGCMAGDEKSWRKMKSYNAMDTRLLEDVYLALRAWDHGHPNMNVFKEQKEGCAKCGSPNVIKRGYWYYGNTTKAARYQCKEIGCGGYSTGKRTKVSEVT